MSAADHTEQPTAKLKMAHVLFMDIVGYSKLPMDHQEAALRTLQEVVSSAPMFLYAEASKEMIRLPTGDGMALVFFEDAETAAHCALEVSRELKSHRSIPLRMGLHSGPVYRVADINANQNVAGEGINIAQRVMDCGDAGHILTSQSVADVLGQLSSWKDSLHDLGEAEVKHGVRVHLYNLYTEDVGNAELPGKLHLAQRIAARAKRKKLVRVGVAVVAVGVGVASWLLYPRHVHALKPTDTIVLADFANSTGDAVFDDTLKQGLTVALSQSPFLNVLGENKVAETLKLMTRPDNSPLTPDVAQELCQRAGSKAYIAGSIVGLGSQYVLGLKAVDCRSGDALAQEQVTAAAKEKVLDAEGQAAAKLRGELGESLATVQKFDVPLEQATTSSLGALKAYSLGRKAIREKGPAAALPYDQHAIQLDPDFAMGYVSLGSDYYSLSETGRGSEYFAKAFELREHASEREKQFITSNYYITVTGELDKATQAYQEQIESYPRDYSPYNELGNVFVMQGQWEKAADMYRQSNRLNPDFDFAYWNLGNAYLALQRFEDVRQIFREAQARKLDTPLFHLELYALAFLEADAAGMEEVEKWITGRPEETFVLSLASDTEAYAGHLGKTRELTRRAVDTAIRADSKENGAIWQENAALREAAFDNFEKAKQAAAEGLKLTPTSQGVGVEAALAYAMVGDTARAESLAQDLNKRFPLDTQMQSLWLPAIRAQVALNQKKPTEALNQLQTATGPIELGQILFVANLSCLYPTYIRGEAYLAAGQGKLAAAEFQKILDHNGIVWNCWTGALAHLGVARGNVLEARTSQGPDAGAARAKARVAYNDFFTLWKDADPDIPVLKQARVESAKLR